MAPLIFTLLLFLNITPVFAQDSGQAQLLYQEGMRAMQENDMKQAEEYLKQASSLDPSNFQYHFELSNIYALRYDQAQQGKGGDFYGREALLAALGQLQQTIMLKPDYVPAHFNMGILYKNHDEFERARECFKKVIRLTPQDTRAYLQVGETYERQGFFDEARDYYARAQEVNAADPAVQDAIESSRRNEVKYEQGRKSRDQTNYLSNASSLFRQSAISNPNGANAQEQSGTPSLASLGMMLAQQVMNKKSQQ